MSSLVVVRTISSMIGGLATGTVRVAWSLLREAFVALRESLRMASPFTFFVSIAHQCVIVPKNK